MKKFNLAILSGIFLMGGVTLASTTLTSCSKPDPTPAPAIDTGDLIISYPGVTFGGTYTWTQGVPIVGIVPTLVDKDGKTPTTTIWRDNGSTWPNSVSFDEENGAIGNTANAPTPNKAKVLITVTGSGSWAGLFGFFEFNWILLPA